MVRLAGAACVTILTLLLIDAPAVAERGEDGTLRVLFWQAPTTVNPFLSVGIKDYAASRIVYEPLASFDAEGTLVPFLAAEIPSLANGGVAADGRSVTWKLRQGVKWADGEPFTADDVVFTHAYASNPEVGASAAPIYSSVESVEAIDDHTVRVRFRAATPDWARPFVGFPGLIIPRHLFEPYNGRNATDAPTNRLAVGTGPYQVASFEEEDLLIIGEDIVNIIKIVYVINPFYREPDRPYFERVELRGGGDPGSAARAVFQDGAADLAWNVQVDINELEALESFGLARLEVAPPASVERIYFNFTDPNRATEKGERSSLAFPHPILSDHRVRKAITLGIDRAAISALYGRTGPVTSNVLISPTTFASPNTSWSHDPEQAAVLLDRAGWVDSDGDGVRDKDGMALHLVLQTSVSDVRQQTQDIVRESLAEIGVDIELKIIDSSIFFGGSASSTNTYQQFFADLQLLSRGNRQPDSAAYMRQWLCEEAAQRSNVWATANPARYCNQAYDALYEQSRTELDPDRRRALFIAMNDLLIEDAAVIPLVGRAQSMGLNNQIVLDRDLTPWDVEVWDIANWRRH